MADTMSAATGTTAAATAHDTAMSINILSLNCWGLKYISKHRAERMKHIGKLISTSHYEIVGLQECWVYSDFLVIQEQCKHILPYSKFYFSGAIGGGLVIMSKWPIEQSNMFRYPLNGRPQAFWRGDYYVGKGVASALIRHDSGKYIEVFCTHLHAPYEAGEDSYLCHRTAQAWEIAKLLRSSAQKGHITIGLGDFNMIPESLAHNLIRTYGLVSDSWLSLYPSCPPLSERTATAEHNVTVMGITCDSMLNTWRATTQPPAGEPDPWAKRLDYIFHSPLNSTVTNAKVSFMDTVPGIGCSVSDHFGIDVTLKLTPSSPDVKFPEFPTSLYDDILALTEGYTAREVKQRKLRIGHFFLMVVCVIAMLVGVWFVEIKGVVFLMMFVSWLWGVGGTLDGLIGFVFTNSEIRALREFKEEMKMQKARVEREARTGRSSLGDIPL